jgi:drug/metabolite transporter (DMT)-like permease
MRQWSAFIYLCIVWGSSFLLIKVALREVTPLSLVSIRLGLATLGLWVIALLSKTRLPTDARLIAALFGLGIVNTTIPFFLITWGEQYIDSGVASILNSTTPLFTLILAHIFLADERITLPRLGGLLLGFGGVVLIFSRGLTVQGGQAALMGQAAVIAASACYGVGVVFTRRCMTGVKPLLIGVVSVTAGFFATLAATFLLEGTPQLTMSLETWAALLVLGLLGVSVAQVLFYYLIAEWGATRSSLVTYIIPVVGVTLGVLFLNESLDWRLFAGFAAILLGILIVNRLKPDQGTTS